MNIENTELLHTDVLIIGGGTAGCYAALTVRENSDYKIIIAEKANIKRSGCLAAGVNAINAYIVKGRKPEDYVDYAKKDADNIVREDLLLTMSEGLNRVTAKMEQLGLVILKDEDGEYVARGNRNIKINGENMKPLLASAVEALPDVTILNRVNITDYLIEDNEIKGAIGFSIEEHKAYVIRAKKVLCATGGAAGLYRPNNLGFSRHKMWYPPFNTGAGFAMGILGGAEMTTFEMRFIALRCKDTIAPTGTTSLMTQTTSGIEPVFLPVYKRRRKVNPNDQNVHIDFVDESGDSYEEFIVFHHKFADWMKANGYDTTKCYTDEEIDELVAQSPYYKATSNDIDWVAKVRMQGQVQKWVDHSISVTVNLPSDVTEELVGNLYIEAWKSGCKGCTVYRDGSRAGVLVSNKDKKQTTSPNEMPAKRPMELDADVVRFQNNKEKWIAFIGLYNGRPYEIFTGIADDEEGIMLPKAVTSGKIVKHYDAEGNSRYDFQFQNKRGFKTTVEGLSYKFDKEYWNYAKLISGVLRHGMPVHQAVELVASMEFDNENINTWKNGVERALKKYIPNGTEATGEKCENCGSPVVYQEGCLICKTCGTSKCG